MSNEMKEVINLLVDASVEELTEILPVIEKIIANKKEIAALRKRLFSYS